MKPMKYLRGFSVGSCCIVFNHSFMRPFSLFHVIDDLAKDLEVSMLVEHLAYHCVQL